MLRGRLPRSLAVTLGCLGLFLMLEGLALADNASVLPKGVFSLTADVSIYLPIDERYNPDGKVENVAVDFNRTLDSRVFPALSALDRFVGGRASLGDSVVSFEYDFTIIDLGFQYGLTDKLSLGIKIPYWFGKNHVEARLDSGPGSSANVGLNPGAGPSLIPIGAGGVPLTTEDVRALLGPGLRGIPGFGFKRFESWSDDGLGDIEAGGKYQFLSTEDWRLAAGGGVRFPTGRVDDPDNLVDYGFGSGTYALLFRLFTDYTLSNLWAPVQHSPAERATGTMAPGEVVLNGTFRYDLVLPDHQTKRVPSDVNNPLTANKENVSRDLGDVFEFEASAKYALPKGFALSGLYRYGFKLKDDVSGKRGFAYQSLEQETDYTEHIFIVALSYSTIPLYQAKKFPIPLNAYISYRNRFAGSNNVFKSEFIGFGIQVFF